MMAIAVDPEWWKTLFDEIYLKTDARSVCDEEISRREVDIFCRLLSLESTHRILDMCGGQGRHSFELWRRGYKDCTVVDYSSHLVDLGKRTASEKNLGVRFMRGDARDTGLPSTSFDNVLILGNSLGYLPDDHDDGRILKEAFRVLKAGSAILVDVTDGDKVVNELIPNAWHEVDEDLVVCRHRELNGTRIKAREMVFSRREGLISERSYAIRVYSPEELKGLVDNAGFVDVEVHRNFSPHGREGDYGFMNKRVLVTARKPGKQRRKG
ncbi:MAG: class I SAM-dependent methyltransferase [Pseudomonadota bacterium]|jgi:D-alanine-D-alanine ligase